MGVSAGQGSCHPPSRPSPGLASDSFHTVLLAAPALCTHQTTHDVANMVRKTVGIYYGKRLHVTCRIRSIYSNSSCGSSHPRGLGLVQNAPLGSMRCLLHDHEQKRPVMWRSSYTCLRGPRMVHVIKH